MKKVKLDEAEEEDVLAQPVRNSRGKVVLKAGQALGSQLKAALRAQGMEYVYVRTEEDIREEIEAELRQSVPEEVKKRFEGTLMHPGMREICRAAGLFLTRKSASDQDG